MQVADVMSEDVVAVDGGATLADAAAAMVDHHVGSVLVLSDGPVGILTETDVIRAGRREDAPFSTIPVSSAMNRDLVTIRPDASVTTALKRMEREGIKKLPVVDGLDLVGILTISDVAHHLPEKVREVRSAVDRRDEWT